MRGDYRAAVATDPGEQRARCCKSLRPNPAHTPDLSLARHAFSRGIWGERYLFGILKGANQSPFITDTPQLHGERGDPPHPG